MCVCVLNVYGCTVVMGMYGCQKLCVCISVLIEHVCV